MEKVSLYKFTYIPLLKNDGQLKQKKAIIQFIKNKNHVPKKNSCLVKQKRKKKEKKKKKKNKTNITLTP